MWTVIFSALSASACLICVAVAISAARIARRRWESPRAAIRSSELRLQSLEDSRTEMLQHLADLTNRLKMSKVRAAAKHADNSGADPDPYTQPDEWRKMMNRRLAEAKMRN